MAGDSLTMYGLWDEFYEGIDVVNRGIGSDVTEGLLNRLDTIVSQNPGKVFLMIGTNDVSRGYDLDEAAGNMAAILDGLSAQLPDAEVYVQSVLPRTAKYAERIEELNGLYEQLCEGREGVTYVDLYPLYCDGDGTPIADLFASDGYHMSGKGYELWAEETI